MDAGNGFAQPAWQAAYPALMAKARANGIALLAVRNSRHFAALWPDVEPLARDGLVALALVNSMACVVPSGGTQALFGTNPTAFAAPRAGHDPLVFDLATSAIAPGEIRSLRAMPSPSAAKPWRALGGAGQTRQPAEVPPCQRGPAGLPRLAAARSASRRLMRPPAARARPSLRSSSRPTLPCKPALGT
ncbi:Ldh family oxidoreductase [Diaphorobacter sp. LI3]|nr:Ldh family oxidoreductase [Diaphorobacter sp. LI3]